LGRIECPGNLGADAPDPNSLKKVIHDPEVDVRLQQCQAHLPQGLFHVRFAQPAAPAKLLKDGLEPRG
jgi:hypothetical protein